jgi:hypothetical protein
MTPKDYDTQYEVEAHDQRYKHGRAARTWDQIASEGTPYADVQRILAQWMYAYEAADARAERAFRKLAARGPDAKP